MHIRRDFNRLQVDVVNPDRVLAADDVGKNRIVAGIRKRDVAGIDDRVLRKNGLSALDLVPFGKNEFVFEIAVIETIMTIPAETRPASTAA